MSAPARGLVTRTAPATGAFWLVGSAAVAFAQPTTDRGIAAAGAAAVALVTILTVGRLTPDRDRRYFRSVVWTMVAVSVVGDWLVQHLGVNANGFVRYGLDTRIALPLIFVLLVPLVVGALPARLRSRALWREHAWREARPLDWVMVAYAALTVPDLLLGLAHHAPKTYIAQDLGLIVFFVFAYALGRTVSVEAGRALAVELVAVLVLMGGAQVLFGLDTTPIFTYVEAACAGAIAFALLRPKKEWLLLVAPAVALLANDAIDVKRGTGSTTAVELAAALGVIAYLVVRVRNLIPQRVVLAIAAVVLVGFLAFTADGAGVLGRYHGSDPSKAGRSFEADEVRTAIHRSPVSFVFGRGLGGSIDETKAPRLFAESLAYGGRDLAHVQAVHLLPYEFLLKYGLLGFAWLAAFVVGLVVLGIGALERAARQRDPTLVVYAAIPLLGVVAALAAATHLQDNPLNAFALGILATRLELVPHEGRRWSWLRLGRLMAAAAVVFAVVGALAFTKPPSQVTYSGPDLLDIPLSGKARVGGLSLNYPRQLGYHKRHFSFGTGRRRERGVVIASYPLERHPQLGGSGLRLPLDGVFFEVYAVPRPPRAGAPTKKLPVTIFDFPSIAAFGNRPTTEQGATFFEANGRTYRAILWVGAKAPKQALIVVDELVAALRVK